MLNGKQIFKEAYSKKQATILNQSFLTAGIGFLVICFIGYMVSFLYKEMNYNPENYETAQMLYILSGISLFISMILYFFWCWNIQKTSNTIAYICIGLYCFSNGVGFGTLFYVFSLTEITLIFAILGFILLGTYAWSKVISHKSFITLSKCIMFLSIMYLITLLISLVLMFVLPNNLVNSSVYLIVTLGGGLFCVLYLVWEFYIISVSDKFVEEEETKRKLGLFFGFNILIDMIAIVWTIARFLLRFSE